MSLPALLGGLADLVESGAPVAVTSSNDLFGGNGCIDILGKQGMQSLPEWQAFSSILGLCPLFRVQVPPAYLRKAEQWLAQNPDKVIPASSYRPTSSKI